MTNILKLVLIGISQDYRQGLLHIEHSRPTDVRSQENIERRFIVSILSSGWKYERAEQAYNYLANEGLIKECLALRDQTGLEKGLRHPLVRHRFPSSKANQIWLTLSRLRALNENSDELFSSFNCGQTLREFFIQQFPGVGMKQASMIIRDLAYFDNLAIIDSHVIWFMQAAESYQHKPGRKNYILLERKLARTADEMNLTMGELDVMIWVAARQFKEASGRRKCKE